MERIHCAVRPNSRASSWRRSRTASAGWRPVPAASTRAGAAALSSRLPARWGGRSSYFTWVIGALVAAGVVAGNRGADLFRARAGFTRQAPAIAPGASDASSSLEQQELRAVSDGRHSRTPQGATTIGRLIRSGVASMCASNACLRALHRRDRAPRIGGALLPQQLARCHLHAREQVDQRVARSGGVRRYSMTSGRSDASRRMALMRWQVDPVGADA